MRYVTLKKEEIEVLEYLHQNSPNNTIRKRSQCLVLSHQRHKIKDLASIFKVSRRTIERWFDSWAKIGVDSLAISEGRGAKTLLKDYYSIIFFFTFFSQFLWKMPYNISHKFVANKILTINITEKNI